MQSLPQSGFSRIKNLLGDSKATPPTPPIIPFSKSTLWLKVAEGSFPAPIKISPRVTVWKNSDIRDYIETVSSGKKWGRK